MQWKLSGCRWSTLAPDYDLLDVLHPLLQCSAAKIEDYISWFLHFSIKEGAVNGFRMGLCVPSSCNKDEISMGLYLALNPSDRYFSYWIQTIFRSRRYTFDTDFHPFLTGEDLIIKFFDCEIIACQSWVDIYAFFFSFSDSEYFTWPTMANNLWEDKEIHLDSGDKGFMYVLLVLITKLLYYKKFFKMS